jgi:hypothetical protein
VADTAIVERYTRALDALIAEVRRDRAVLAAILCGSLSHDTVWERSDIDLALVTIDDKKVPASSLSLLADGVTVHAWLMPRAQFRRIVEGAVRNSFVHSLLAKGRLLYTHDETIAELCRRLQGIGERDKQIQLLRAATSAIGSLDKARKWLVTRGDLDYTAVWILYAATSLAQLEIISAGRLADREVLPNALALNPAFFKIVYSDLLNGKKTMKSVESALAAADGYLGDRAASIFALVLEHLREVGDTRSATDIDAYFARTYDLQGAALACEYLANHGYIGKASTAVRLTRMSTVDVQELAFFDLGDRPDDF